ADRRSRTDCRQPSSTLNLAEAVQLGLKHARGEVLAWLRPGDLATVDALRAAGQAFADDPELDVILGNAVHIDDAGRFRVAQIGPWPDGFWSGKPPDPIGLTPPPPGVVPVAPATVYFRRRMLERCGG